MDTIISSPDQKFKNYIYPLYQRKIAEKKWGFGVIPAGTGLGKTDAIKDVVENIANDENETRKAVYVSGTVRLRDEMQEKLAKNPATKDAYVVIGKNLEILLNNRNILEKLFDHPIIAKYISFTNQGDNAEDKKKSLEWIEKNQHKPDPKTRNELDEKVIQFFNFFKTILKKAWAVSQAREEIIICYNKADKDDETFYKDKEYNAREDELALKNASNTKKIQITYRSQSYDAWIIDDSRWNDEKQQTQANKKNSDDDGELTPKDHLKVLYESNADESKPKIITVSSALPKDEIKIYYKGKAYPAREIFDKGDYEKLLKEEAILKLFPYIEYDQNPQKKILLLTYQKWYYGFFNGKSVHVSISFMGRNEKSRIVFLDEVDFAEGYLLDLVTQSMNVPFIVNFVQAFLYLERRRLNNPNWMTNKKLYENEDSEITIRQRVEDICKYIHGIRQLDVAEHIICKELEKAKRKGSPGNFAWRVFHSAFSVTNEDRFIDLCTNPDGSISFNITEDPTDYPAYEFYQKLKNAAKQIVRFYKDVEIYHPDLYKNSLLEPVYKTFEKAKDFIRRSRKIKTRTRGLRTNKEHHYYQGVQFTELKDLADPESPASVDIILYDIAETPELILLNLASKNLVFGLSATANIKRVLNNFSLDFIRDELRRKDQEYRQKQQVKLEEDLAEKGSSNIVIKSEYIKYFEITSDDEDDIKQANDAKQKERGNEIILLKNKIFKVKSKYNACVQDLLENIQKQPFVKSSGKTGPDDPHNPFLYGRVERFFHTLCWAIAHPNELDTHALFFQSFKQILSAFKMYINNPPVKIRNPENNQLEVAFSITKDDAYKEETKEVHIYQLQLLDYKANVIFYDAKQGRRLEQMPKRYYELFWKNELGKNLPVFLITTFKSAGVGVNFQYYLSEKDYVTKNKKAEKDFIHTHILDTDWFYFTNVDQESAEDEQEQTVKKNMYKLGKLYVENEINMFLFKQKISKARNLKDLNRWYTGAAVGNIKTRTYDGMLNQITVINQALGRSNRVWCDMPTQFVQLTPEAFKYLTTFLTETDAHGNQLFVKQLKESAPLLANNIKSVYEQAVKQHKNIDELIRDESQEELKTLNSKSKNLIEVLVIQVLQQPDENIKGEKEAYEKIKKNWERLGLLFLQHRYKEIMRDFGESLVFEADPENFNYDLTSGKSLIIDKNLNVALYYEGKNHKDYWEWSIDSVYKEIIHNDIVFKYFRGKGYNLSFDASPYFFTPYSYQAILKGRIGEEAIKALLTKASQISEDMIDIALDDNMPYKIYENCGDFKIKGCNYIIDAKFFSENTLESSVDQKDEEFKSKARAKYKAISDYYKNDDCKLIFITLLGQSNALDRYYNADITEDDGTQSFEDAKIIVIQGAIEKDEDGNYNAYRDGFKKLIKNIMKAL